MPVWSATLPPRGTTAACRTPLDGDVDADVAIVGAGLTGLWTARELLVRDPGLRVRVLERDQVGAGASGRNGGWCSGLLPVELPELARRFGRDAAVRWQRRVHAAVDDVLAVLASEGIDAQAHKGGTLAAARNPVQRRRLLDEVATARSFGFGDDDLAWLSRAEARAVVAVEGTLGATFTPHCAALHPGRLVHGLAAAAERRGAVIHESTPVLRIEPGRVRTSRGTVRAEVVVRATEAHTVGLPGSARAVVPVQSLMIATEPLPAAVFDELGWAGRATVADARRLVVYGQRTADDRIAFGGRGAPYHWGSAIAGHHSLDLATHGALARTLVELFPVLAEATVTHRWGGALAVSRDWMPSVGLDRSTGLAWAGGYAGDGVTLTHLAGRTLADLITGDAGPDTTLPWVGHRSPRFEPEPLRFIGLRSGVALVRALDAAEQRTGRTPRPLATLARLVIGR